MRISEIFRLVWLNLSQNKFKVIMTSIGIVVGSATIMMVLAIGTGGKQEVAEQFKNLNAGAIDISFESASGSTSGNRGGRGGDSGTESSGGGMSMPSGGGRESGGGSLEMPNMGSMPDMSNMPDMSSMFGGNGGMDFGSFPGGSFGFSFGDDNRMNQETIVLSSDDLEDLEVQSPILPVLP